MKKFKFPKLDKAFFLNLPIVSQLLQWSKQRSLPGFFGVPIYDVVVFVFNEVKRFDLSTRANSMAFSFFLSIFPILISLFTLLPYLKRYLLSYLPDKGENFDKTLQYEIQEFMPGNMGLEFSQFIEDLIDRPRVGLLSFGFVLAIFFASNGMIAMMRGFEKSYLKTFKKRTALKKRLIAILLTFQLGILLVSSVILIIMGNLLIGWLADYISLDRFTELSIYLIRWIVIISLFYTVIAIIYRHGAAVRRKFNFFSPGTTLATTLSIISSLLFSFYVDNFSQYNKLYGSFGTIIVTMLWLQINSFILLIGFELNASIAVNRDLKLEHEEED